MSGNDIIDIKLAAKESNWQRKGYIEKIFTPQEQTYIRNTLHPENLIWILWSMKESVYKVYTRQFGGRFFAPKKIECTILNNNKGKVRVNEVNYKTTTCITSNFIYTIAQPEELSAIPLLNRWFICKEKNYMSQPAIYKKIIIGYASISGKQPQFLSIIKNNDGIPGLYCEKEKLYTPVSISHHGRYGAFTIN